MPKARTLRKRLFNTVDRIRGGAEAVGLGVDRLGDRAMKMARVVSRNPAPTLAISTAILYAIARIPIEFFYSAFGVQPENVGLDSVDIFLQASAIMLISFILISAAFALAGLLIAIVLMVPHSIVVGRLPRRGPKLSVWQSTAKTLRRILRLSPIAVPLITIPLALISFSLFAIEDAKQVKYGWALHEALVPWKADRVEVTWTGQTQDPHPPHCGPIIYLGEDDGRVVLYDSQREDTYLVNSGDVQLGFPVTCAERAVRHRFFGTPR